MPEKQTSVKSYLVTATDEDKLLSESVSAQAIAMFRAGVLGVPPGVPDAHNFLEVIRAVAEAAAWLAIKTTKAYS